MPKNQILDYVKELMASAPAPTGPGPVITISREYGCPGRPVSEKLVQELNKKSQKEWKLYDKEILNLAAEEVKISPQAIENAYKGKPKGFFEETLMNFSESAPSDVKIKKAVAGIVRKISTTGNAVILGRGSVVIAKDLEKSLHIHLYAAANWRKEKVKQMDNLKTDAEALKKLEEVDKERIYLRDYFSGEKTDNHLFDLAINCETNSVDDVVAIILYAAGLKKL